MFKRVCLLMVMLTLLIVVSPTHAQLVRFESASQRFSLQIPESWVGTNTPLFALQNGFPSEALTVASSQATLDNFVRGNPSFLFEEYDYNYHQFHGAVLSSLMWPAGLLNAIDFYESDLEYSLEYIGDEYESPVIDTASIGAFSGSRYTRTWRDLTLRYYFLQEANGAVLLITFISDSANLEQAEAVLASFEMTTFTLADLNNPEGQTHPFQLNGGVMVGLPKGWWGIGAMQNQYFTAISPSADLLIDTAFGGSMDDPGVVIGAYQWQKPSSDALWPDLQNAAQNLLGVHLTVITSERVSETDGVSITNAHLQGELLGRTVEARAVLWEDDQTITALAAVGTSTALEAFAPMIDKVLGSALPPAKVDETIEVSPPSGRYAFTVPANWILEHVVETAGDFDFTGIFPQEAVFLINSRAILPFVGDNLLADYDFVGYEVIPDAALVVGTILPAGAFEALGMTIDVFLGELSDDEDLTTYPVEGQGITGTLYVNEDDEAGKSGQAFLQDAEGNLYIFVVAASESRFNEVLAVLNSIRLQDLPETTTFEIAADALNVQLPSGWWAGYVLPDDFLEDEGFEVLMASPDSVLTTAALIDPEDWPRELPGLTSEAFTSVAVGGATFTDLRGISEFIRSDGTIDGRLVALFLIEEADAGSRVKLVNVGEWSNSNGLNGTLVEATVTLDIQLASESTRVELVLYAVGVQVGDSLAVMVGVCRAEDAATYWPIIEGIFESATAIN